MEYPNMTQGVFLRRPNRFIAHVEVHGREEICHVKNTGRCRELLVPGCRVYLVESDNPSRKTRYDLVTVEKQRGEKTLCINMDSQAPNRLFGEWAEKGNFRRGLTKLKAETTFGNSRFDYYWEISEKRGFVEVKGVTLEENGVARFPDAPTQRGVKHLEELIRARNEGYEAAVCFVVQMKGMDHLEPNDATHPEFGAALRRCREEGVEILALECEVVPGRVEVIGTIPVVL